MIMIIMVSCLNDNDYNGKCVIMIMIIMRGVS